MKYWLMKSEPETWSWDAQVKKGTEPWNGVRNYQAANNMKAMKKGDLAFFYHSGEERRIVGIVEIAKEYYPDPTDETGRFGMVDVRTKKPLNGPVTLSTIKSTAALKNMPLIRQSRLSVMPVSAEEWKIINDMAKVKP